MANQPFNVAKKQLREDELSIFISGLFFNAFTGIFDASVVNSQFAHLTGSETFLGSKVFAINPFVNYTGTSTGQTVALAFIQDREIFLQNNINATTTGLQGVAHLSGLETVYGEKHLEKLIINSGRVTGRLEVPYPINTSGAVSLEYLTNTLSTLNSLNLYVSGDQLVSGNKRLIGDGAIYVPTATHPSGVVPLSQLTSTGNNILNKLTLTGLNIAILQNQIDSIDLTVAANVTGFGGVLSLNAQSGNLFTQGRGTVTTVQNGNVLSISGHTLDGYTGCVLGSAIISSGVDRQFIGYGRNFSVAPHVFTQLISISGVSGITSFVSGEITSGFHIVFNNNVNTSGYVLNFMAMTGTGALVNVVVGPAGERGISGANGLSVTGDNVNLGFYFNSVYTGIALAESFVSKNFRVSGWAVGCVDYGTGSQVLTGNFYQRTTGNNKVNIVGFSLGTGAYFTGVYLNSLPTFSGLNRLGVDILAKSTGISKLSLGLFGFGA